MRESIPTLFGPVGDDRHNACIDGCEADLSRCSRSASARASETCDRTYQNCVEDCDREEGVVRVYHGYRSTCGSTHMRLHVAFKD